jgi:Uncharacterized conserved protein
MRVFISVDEAGGLESPFWMNSARRRFLVVDGDRVEVYRNVEVIKGRGDKREETLQLRPDAVITREIGKPAHQALRARGVKLYFAEGTTAREALERLKRGELREFPAGLAHEPRRRH